MSKNNKRAWVNISRFKSFKSEFQFCITCTENRMPLIDILLSGPNDSLTNKDIREEIDTFMFEVYLDGEGWKLSIT